MKLIWSDEFEDAVGRHAKRTASDSEASAIAIAAMSFFVACLAMAGLVAWAVR
jgi:hypothetical protein